METLRLHHTIKAVLVHSSVMYVNELRETAGGKASAVEVRILPSNGLEKTLQEQADLNLTIQTFLLAYLYNVFEQYCH